MAGVALFFFFFFLAGAFFDRDPSYRLAGRASVRRCDLFVFLLSGAVWFYHQAFFVKRLHRLPPPVEAVSGSYSFGLVGLFDSGRTVFWGVDFE